MYIYNKNIYIYIYIYIYMYTYTFLLCMCQVLWDPSKSFNAARVRVRVDPLFY